MATLNGKELVEIEADGFDRRQQLASDEAAVRPPRAKLVYNNIQVYYASVESRDRERGMS